VIDTVLKALALVSFVVFIAFLPIFVPLPDLILVVVIVAGMATFDLLIYPAIRRRRRS